jgi:hypothetical protein
LQKGVRATLEDLSHPGNGVNLVQETVRGGRTWCGLEQGALGNDRNIIGKQKGSVGSRAKKIEMGETGKAMAKERSQTPVLVPVTHEVAKFHFRFHLQSWSLERIAMPSPMPILRCHGDGEKK